MTTKTAWALKPKDENRLAVLFGNYGTFSIFTSEEGARAAFKAEKNENNEIIEITINWV